MTAAILMRLLLGIATQPRVKPTSQLRFDYDTTTTRLRQIIDMLIFCSRRIANFDHFRRSRIRRGIIVYLS